LLRLLMVVLAGLFYSQNTHARFQPNIVFILSDDEDLKSHAERTAREETSATTGTSRGGTEGFSRDDTLRGELQEVRSAHCIAIRFYPLARVVRMYV
jgi:hypothetical protein